MTTTQGPVPLQAPLQPANVDPPAGAAVSVTGVPAAKLAVQVGAQEMPLGLLVTIPLPVPVKPTVKTAPLTTGSNRAETVAVALTVQAPVPAHPPPLHPANLEPAAAVAINVTVVPASNRAAHAAPQSMPGGLEVTVPVPVPCF